MAYRYIFSAAAARFGRRFAVGFAIGVQAVLTLFPSVHQRCGWQVGAGIAQTASSIPDLERLSTSPQLAACPGFNGFALSVGQGLEEASLLRIDVLDPGIELCHSAKRAAPLGSAPGLLELQASDLQERPMGNRNQGHLPCQCANGPQTSKWDGHDYLFSRSCLRRFLLCCGRSPHTVRIVSFTFSAIRDWP